MVDRAQFLSGYAVNFFHSGDAGLHFVDAVGTQRFHAQRAGQLADVVK